MKKVLVFFMLMCFTLTQANAQINIPDFNDIKEWSKSNSNPVSFSNKDTIFLLNVNKVNKEDRQKFLNNSLLITGLDTVTLSNFKVNDDPTRKWEIEFLKSGNFQYNIRLQLGGLKTNDTAILIIATEKNKPLATIKIAKDDSTAKPAKPELPVSSFNILNIIPTKATPCEFCSDSIDIVTYDYAKTRLSYRINKSKFDRHYKSKVTNDDADKSALSYYPRVGRSLVFHVANINPFRDSVIISYETLNYNTEMPKLINTAFFSPVIPSAQGKTSTDSCKQLLADVYALGNQLQIAKNLLADLKSCDGVCKQIENYQEKIVEQFKNLDKYDPSQPLEIWIPSHLGLCVTQKDKDSVIKILSDYYLLRSSKTYFDYDVPKLQNVDEYVFNLSVLPKKGFTSAAIVDHQPISVPLTGGFKVDASSGLFLTTLTDNRFTLKDSLIGNDSVKKIIRQDNGKWDFGVAALMHFYPRISTWFNISASLGAGLSIGPNPSIRYLAGGTVMFGRNARFGVTFGSSMGFVNRLSDAYTSTDYVTPAEKDNITKKVFRAKNFWSFTFNIPIFKTKVDTAKETADAEANKPDASDNSDEDSSGKGKEETNDKK